MPQNEHALFVTRARAAVAVQRLRFIRSDSIRDPMSWFPHYERGALVGYKVRYTSPHGRQIVTEDEVQRYGL